MALAMSGVCRAPSSSLKGQEPSSIVGGEGNQQMIESVRDSGQRETDIPAAHLPSADIIRSA